MKRRSCASLALVEAAHDGRLGQRDIESLQRHMSICDECAKLAKDLDTLRNLARQPTRVLSELEYRRTRVRLLQTAARLENPNEKHRWPLVVGGFVVAATMTIFLMSNRAPEHSLVARTGLREYSEVIRHVTVVHPSRDALFTRETKDGLDRITLEAGTLHIAVRPLQTGERFLVVTRDAEVEVRGTIFGVQAASTGIQRVFVSEGKVEVRYAGAQFFVMAGGEWHPPERNEISSQGNDAPPEQATSNPEPKRKSAIPASSAKRPTNPDDASRQFGDAVGAMEKGNYGTAAERLDRFAQEHPEDARAEDAAFLVILAMKRAGRHDEAAEAARRYLVRFPKGFRRSEAESIANSRPTSP